MGCFLHADHIVFLPLILVDVVCAVAIAKAQPRSVGKAEHALGRIVIRHAMELAQQGHNMVFPQLGQRAPQQKRIQPRRCESEQHELSAHGPAFPAAARTSIGGMPRLCPEKFRLARVWRPA